MLPVKKTLRFVPLGGGLNPKLAMVIEDLEHVLAPLKTSAGRKMSVPSSVPNFTSISATCRPCGAKNLKIGL